MVDEEINDVKIIDKDGIDLPWSYIFFILHKHCNLNKFTIMDYTLPQITELMLECDKYIQFEVNSKIPMMPMLGGGDIQGGSEDSDGFHEATEDDINEFAKFLGGM